MSPLLDLITAWDTYTSKMSESATVKAFCEFYLSEASAKKETSHTPALSQELARLTGRLSSIHKTYLKLAFKELPDAEIEWYFLLHSINRSGEVRKTEVGSINLLLEPTTCIDILNRMIKAGLLNEKIDAADKRARLLSINHKGSALLKQMQQLVNDINDKLYGHMDKTDQELIVRSLIPVEKEHTEQLLNAVKRKRAQEVK